MNTTNLNWERSQYELLDFGLGRKLERFGGLILDRVSPAADGWKRSGNIDWQIADLRLDRQGKRIAGRPTSQDNWPVRFDGIVFNLKVTPFGHVGLFPEQANSWRWLLEQLDSDWFSQRATIRALNLFAYTGGTTLTLSRAGVEVAHVDASSPAVSWARANAATSGLDQNPIRWIVEDAKKYVTRELRRGKRYEIIVLDPPSFGHGTSGKRWDLQQDLDGLLDDCARLLSSDSSLVLITCHSRRPDAPDMLEMLERSLARAARRLSAPDCEGVRLQLFDRAGRGLDAGFTVRGRVEPAL